jgi:CheY-like chemotaxis protein
MARILVVDDDPGFQEIASQVLTSAGYEVLALGSGIEAVETYKHFQPDLMIVDLLMPDMDGLEVMRAIYHIDRSAKVMAITGAGGLETESYLRAARFLGADASMAKPFTGAELLAKVEEMLAQHGARDGRTQFWRQKAKETL